MIETAERDRMFELHMQNFERNRMYPPGYGKDCTMTKPKMKHVSAITRSVNLLESGLADELEKRFHKAIERDLDLMREVKTMLLTMIENPTLPFMGTVNEQSVPVLNVIDDEPNEAL